MLLQLLANGIVNGCSMALVAMGFALIYNTTRIFHFAHGALYTVAAYLLFTGFSRLDWPLAVAILMTVLVVACAGVITDEVLYRPLDKRQASPLIHLLSSLGLYIVLVNSLAMIFGSENKILSSEVQPTYQLGSVILTRLQVVTIGVTVLLFAGVVAFLRFSRYGLLIRAMRDNPTLVAVRGINPRRVRWVAFALGSGLASVAAVLQSLDVGMDPHMGMAAILTAAVAMIVGGVGIFEGAALGALLLGIIQGLAIWKLSAQWQEAITFAVLILFLLFRPQGLLGGARRVEESMA